MNGEIMMERIKYEELEFEVIAFENTDVITDSEFSFGDFDTDLN